jgi:UDP-N-acetylmuramoyl-L-alanyl-D-glutamate--2,6-diaminopimelate ligase
VSLDEAVDAISHIQSASGRMQLLGGGDLPLVVVDYTHTPDALEKVLSTLKEQASAKLICVFGCGGNRDVGKRELMGKVASEIADAVVVTSDNPRGEAPEAIIHAIVGGMHGNYAVEEDRAKAISIAILAAKPNDIVLIAGKGHEDYQEIAGKKHHFSDVEQAQNVLNSYRVASL